MHKSSRVHTGSHRFITIVVIILILFVGFKLVQTFLNNKKSNITPIPEEQKVDQLVDMSLVQEIYITEANNPSDTTGSYPQFKNASSFFNDKIKNDITIAMAEFKDSVKDSERPGDMYFEVHTDYFQVNENNISILITIEQFTGGAHGFDSLYSYNYDVKNNKELKLKDFFPNDPNYLKKVSDFSRKELTNKFQNELRRADYPDDESYNAGLSNMKSMMQAGTQPTLENFSVFTFTPEYLYIHFAEYQVAAYVYGKQVVKMPLK